MSHAKINFRFSSNLQFNTYEWIVDPRDVIILKEWPCVSSSYLDLFWICPRGTTLMNMWIRGLWPTHQDCSSPILLFNYPIVLHFHHKLVIWDSFCSAISSCCSHRLHMSFKKALLCNENKSFVRKYKRFYLKSPYWDYLFRSQKNRYKRYWDFWFQF